MELKDLIGDKGARVKIEESWSKDLPNDSGANAAGVVDPILTEERLNAAVKQTQRLRGERLNAPVLSVLASPVIPQARAYYFFVLDYDKKILKFLGKCGMNPERFQKDISGRMFREWLKKEFPERRDYEDISAFEVGTKLSEIFEGME